MNTKELAKLLNGRAYGSEITKEEKALAKDNNLVVVFGASDDCVELRGAINDEFGTEGIYLNKNGLAQNVCNDEDCPHWEEKKEESARIQSEYCNYPDMPNGWGFRINEYDGTPIPHETFEIWEDEEIWCKGIVFSLEDIN